MGWGVCDGAPGKCPQTHRGKGRTPIEGTATAHVFSVLERYDSARAGGGALPVIMSIIRSSEKPRKKATNARSEERRVVGPVQFAGCTAQQYSVSVGSMVLPGEVSIAEMVQTSTERLVVHYSQRTEAS